MTPAVWAALIIAVAFEVVGTTLLQASQQFTKPWAVAGMLLCYALSFYLLSQALRVLPLGVAYALWSGFGIMLVTLIGLVVFRQRLDTAAVVGIGLIVAGVVVINLLSETTTH
ncbi:QacE family quaternary ammonium compound efflux SMR transporter [Paracoccus sp. S-4012]|uniref:DMT family transporter n=1 Tax=Paracoccus sp. S-4012 TaxID=2665648 RepID=UPI001329D0D6|nr:QacE family quaternary ammonium compound efflux SMR transporter [Paracoccus sp. S-4012]